MLLSIGMRGIGIVALALTLALPAAATAGARPSEQHARGLTWITPDQYNDQHAKLTAGYGVVTPATDQSAIAQGDNFLARVVPFIIASDAYQDGGVIVLWWDESEGGDFKLPFMIISKETHEDVNGLPFASSVEYSYSSFLRTMQEIFGVDPDDGFGG